MCKILNAQYKKYKKERLRKKSEIITQRYHKRLLRIEISQEIKAPSVQVNWLAREIITQCSFQFQS